MKRSSALKFSGSLLVLLGLTGFIISALSGGVEIFFLFIIPVLRFQGLIPLFSVLSIFFGTILLFLAISFEAIEKARGKEAPIRKDAQGRDTKWGGVIFLGPIPVIFGSVFSRLDRRLKIAYIAFLMLVVVIFFIVLSVLLFRK